MIVSVLKKRKSVYLSTTGPEHSKNPFVNIIIGIVSITTGIIALLIYVI